MSNLIKDNKEKIINILYITIIVLGSIFVSISCFHSNMWFDESYSVAIANHSFAEIWSIGSNDVHPVLYYWMIHIIIMLTNNNILFVRLFSCLPLIIMSILGYTIIRKEFGEKVGLMFSFLSLFMPVCVVYSGEIRMYTWAMLFVVIMSLYAYKILKEKFCMKNWIIFSIFSLSSAYTHYYGLITAFVINMAIIIFFIIKSIKSKENVEINTVYLKNLKCNIFSAIIQIILYIPWLGTVINQAKAVSGSFWIGDPQFLQILEFQFTGNLPNMEAHLQPIISWSFIIIMSAYIIYLLIKNRKIMKPIIITMSIYLIVVAIILFISKVLKRPILYPRYFLNITGLFLFSMAFIIGNDKNWIRIVASVVLIAIVATITNIGLCKTNYDNTNSKPKEYIQNRIENGDILLIDNNGSGFVIATQVIELGNKTYFWDRKDWNVEKAYKAYGETITSLDSLKDYKGRIWVLSSGDFSFAKTVKSQFENSEILEQEEFAVAYQEYQYSISLLEVN